MKIANSARLNLYRYGCKNALKDLGHASNLLLRYKLLLATEPGLLNIGFTLWKLFSETPIICGWTKTLQYGDR
jgi:hypothetical protein